METKIKVGAKITITTILFILLLTINVSATCRNINIIDLTGESVENPLIFLNVSETGYSYTNATREFRIYNAACGESGSEVPFSVYDNQILMFKVEGTVSDNSTVYSLQYGGIDEDPGYELVASKGNLSAENWYGKAPWGTTTWQVDGYGIFNEDDHIVMWISPTSTDGGCNAQFFMYFNDTTKFTNFTIGSNEQTDMNKVWMKGYTNTSQARIVIDAITSVSDGSGVQFATSDYIQATLSWDSWDNKSTSSQSTWGMKVGLRQGDSNLEDDYLHIYDIVFCKDCSISDNITYELGSETSPLLINIYSPENTTYFTTNINFTFNVISQNANNFEVKAYFEDTLIYSNSNYENATNVTIDLSSYITGARTYYVKVWANDSIQTNEKTRYFTVEDYEIESVTYNNLVYETSDQNFTIVIRYNPDLISSITTELYYDGTNEGEQDYQTKNSTHIINTKTVSIPIVNLNNTEKQFFFSNRITYTNSTTYVENTSNYSQHVMFAYWINSITPDKTNYIEFEDATIYFYVENRSDKASLYANITFVYNSSYSVTSNLIQFYQYDADTLYFTDTFDTLTAFSDSETRTYYGNVTVCFDGNCRTMNSSTNTINVYKMVLTNCSASSLSQTQALVFYFYDEEDDSEINGSADATFFVYKTNELRRNYSFNFSDNHSFSVCIYPAWAEYYVDGDIIYSGTDYRQRTYYLYNATINNATQSINLYSIKTTSSSKVIIYTKDSNDQAVENVIVKILRYYYDTNTYKTVAIGKSDSLGKIITYLVLDTAWYKFILEQDGVVKNEYSPMIIPDTELDPETLTLYISATTPEYYRIQDISYSCTFNSETNVTRCTVSDPTGLMVSACLKVNKIGPAGTEEICNTCDTSSSMTLTCTLPELEGTYTYSLSVTTSSGNTYVLKTDYLYFPVEGLFGSFGIFMAIVLLLVVVMISIYNPFVASILAAISIGVSIMFGLIEVSVIAFVSLLITAIMFVIVGRRA